MSGITLSSVCPSYGLPGSAFTCATNCPPLQRRSGVATLGDARERANRVLKVSGVREEIAGWAPPSLHPLHMKLLFVRVALGDAQQRPNRVFAGGFLEWRLLA